MDFEDIDQGFMSLVRNSLRIDNDTDTDLLTKIIVAARKNIAGQVEEDDLTFYDNNEEFDYAVVLLASHLYTNRSATSTSQLYEVPIALENLILSLKESYLVKISANNDSGDNSG